MPGFIADDQIKVSTVYFEDSHSDLGIQGHGTRLSFARLEDEIREAAGRLGALITSIMPGQFEGKPLRYGYRIEGLYGGQRLRIDVAALPIRSETETRKKEALKQALYNVRDALKTQYMMLLLSPGSVPLLPYLLVPGQDRTMSEVMREQVELPSLSQDDGYMLIAGEVVE